jgi:hypothetical protein
MVDKDNYIPRGEAAAVLDRAWALRASVPYRVTARWLFYRLLQEGYYNSKADYSNKWLKIVSRARHAFYGGWRPDTLADETREAIDRGHGHDNPEMWLQAVSEHLTCNLAKWYGQDYYIELWFEARAMIDQFAHYTDHITLRPMGGQPSIPYKWETAKQLERYSARYGKPIVILYFGDLDPGGEMIETVTRDDVRKWCDVPFEFIRCGLNPGDPQRYNIPENPEKPGAYQWEALTDDAARNLITGNVARYVRHDAFVSVEDREDRVTGWLRGELVELVGQYPGD